MGVLNAIDMLMAQTGAGKEAAIATVLTNARLPEYGHLARMFELARDERGASGDLPSSRTIKRWFKQREEAALAPKVRQEDLRQPEWAALFLGFYQAPQKPSVQRAYDQFAAVWTMQQPLAKLPSVYQVRRFLDKLGNVSRQKGRMGRREIKNIQPYVVRAFLHLEPTEIYTADGHTFDAEVLHPDSGKPFRPEITTIADVATRKITGWSVDLAESGMAVLMALSHACETNGIGAIFYVDNGGGYKNAMMTDEATGLMGRLGMSMVHSLPYSSQARGVIERLHKTVWVEAAKSLQSYMGADMDAEAKQQVHKASRALANRGASLKGVPALANIRSLNPHLLPTWAEFVAFCEWHVARYNDRPHRSLPKVLDVDGKQRHMTPNEMWALKVAEGAKLVQLAPEEKHQLFMPQQMRVVQRGQVFLRNNRYYSARLEEYHGDTVRVAYDIHDAEHVWLYDDVGRLICQADWNGNHTDYMPVSMREQAKEKRIDAQVRRLRAKEATVLAARPQRVLAHQESVSLGGVVLDLGALQQKGDEAEAYLLSRRTTETVEAVFADAEPEPEPEPVVPEQLGWQVPEQPEERMALYLRIKDAADLPEMAARWVLRYPSSHEFKALSRQAAAM